MSKRGYATGVIGTKWLKTFHEDTCDRSPNGETHILLVDGHGSHLTIEGLQFAVEHNIDVLAYPPHCTHALQGLDVSIFGPLKTAYSAAVTEFEATHNEAVGRDNFTQVLKVAWDKIMTPQNLQNAFRKAGSYPVNRAVISSQQLAPAKANSLNPGFLVSTPSPVRTMVAAMLSETLAHTSLSVPSPSVSNLVTPCRRTVAQVTPYCAHKAHAASSLLRGTSAAFLLEPEISSEKELPSPAAAVPLSSSPDWTSERADPERPDTVLRLCQALRKAKDRAAFYKKAYTGALAQMTLQHLHLRKLAAKLRAKKKPRNDVRKLIFKNGNGVMFTRLEILQHIQDAEDVWQEKERKRTAGKVAAATCRTTTVAKKSQQTRARALWADACESWEKERKAAKAGGRNGKVGPKPKLKDIMQQIVAADRDEQHSSDGDMESTEGVQGQQGRVNGAAAVKRVYNEGDDAGTDSDSSSSSDSGSGNSE